MSNNDKYLDQAARIAVSNLAIEQIRQTDETQEKFHLIMNKINKNNLLELEGEIYSISLTSNEKLTTRLQELFDKYRRLMQFEKPKEDYKQELFDAIRAQINKIHYAYMLEERKEAIETRREVNKHFRALDYTVAKRPKRKIFKKKSKKEEK